MDTSIIKDDVNVKPNWRLLSTNVNPKLQTLFDIYKEDKAKAKIYYHLNKDCFTTTRKVLFEYPNGDFKFVMIRKTHGISSSNKMYSREKTIESIIYKGNKFYYFTNLASKFVKQLTYHDVYLFTNKFGHMNDINEYMVGRFGWLRFIQEDYFFHNITLNTIIGKRLFNKKALLRHVYGCPYPVANFVHEYTMNSRAYMKYLPVWKEMRKNLINIENLSVDMFKNPLFQDSCRFAQMLGVKVNCSWGDKRLKNEHDKWSKIITGVLLENEPFMELNIHPIFLEFAEHSGFEILKSNHALIAEGNRMNHCVGTYAPNVNRYLSGIYVVDGYTLELNRNMVNNSVRINQFMGHSNISAPRELHDYVKGLIDSFDASEYAIGFTKNLSYAELDNDLPF